ncbi:hypothetical protein A2U01_0097604, partial [Trifolium medium]|nr:hypothetical protein [Trifolium medium]
SVEVCRSRYFRICICRVRGFGDGFNSVSIFRD